MLQVPAQFVDAILALHTKFSELITTTLGSDLAFTIALDKVSPAYYIIIQSVSHQHFSWGDHVGGDDVVHLVTQVIL